MGECEPSDVTGEFRTCEFYLALVPDPCCMAQPDILELTGPESTSGHGWKFSDDPPHGFHYQWVLVSVDLPDTQDQHIL